MLALVIAGQLTSCASTIKHEKPVDNEADLSAYFAAHELPLCTCSMPKIYFSGSQWSKRALELIESAHDYILITVFLGNLHEYSAPVYDALMKKAQQGVRVYFIVDPSSYLQYRIGTKEVLPVVSQTLAKAGVHVAEYNSFSGERLFTTVNLLDREHRKYWIVDGKYVTTGGMNINQQSLAPFAEGGQMDTTVEVESEDVVRRMVRSFCVTWNAFSPEHIDPADFPIQPVEAPETSLWLADQGLDNKGTTDAMFDAFFLYAKKEIWMIQSFSFVTNELLDKIRSATSRGVKVNILISNHGDMDTYDRAMGYCLQPLMDAGANVYLYTSPEKVFIHYKLMMADQTLVAFGSANFNFRSEHLSREMEFVFNDARVVQQAYQNLQSLTAQTRLVTLEEAKSYRTFNNFLQYLVMVIGG
jgi:cardiolipin synthase